MSNAHGDQIDRRAATRQTIANRQYTKPNSHPGPISLWPVTLLGLLAIIGFVALIIHVYG
jgi:hypothetical protein